MIMDSEMNYKKKESLMKKNAILYMKDIAKCLDMSSKELAGRAGYNISSVNRNIKIINEMEIENVENYIDSQLTPFVLTILFTIDKIILENFSMMSLETIRHVESILFKDMFDITKSMIYTKDTYKEVSYIEKQEWMIVDFFENIGFVSQMEYLSYKAQISPEEDIDIKEVMKNRNIAFTIGALMRYRSVYYTIINVICELTERKIENVYVSSLYKYTDYIGDINLKDALESKDDSPTISQKDLPEDIANDLASVSSDFDRDIIELIMADSTALLFVRDKKEIERIQYKFKEEFLKNVVYAYYSKDMTTLVVTDGKKKSAQYGSKSISEKIIPASNQHFLNNILKNN